MTTTRVHVEMSLYYSSSTSAARARIIGLYDEKIDLI